MVGVNLNWRSGKARGTQGQVMAMREEPIQTHHTVEETGLPPERDHAVATPAAEVDADLNIPVVWLPLDDE